MADLSYISTGGTIETILTNCTTVWYARCTATEQKDLHCVVKAAKCIVVMELPNQAPLSGTPHTMATPCLNHCCRKTFQGWMSVTFCFLCVGILNSG